MRNIGLWGVLAVLLAASVTEAGTIYTSRAAFEAALTSPTNRSEDFESFGFGPVANPLTIMGGTAEILDTNPAITFAGNTVGGPSPSKAWIANVGNNANPAGIRGVGATNLGVSAIGFDFAHEQAGNFWTFNTSLGTDFGAVLPAGPPVMDSFVGWIANPGESLNSVVWSGTGLIVDNVVAVPEPASLALLGSALVGLAAARRRKRTA